MLSFIPVSNTRKQSFIHTVLVLNDSFMSDKQVQLELVPMFSRYASKCVKPYIRVHHFTWAQCKVAFKFEPWTPTILKSVINTKHIQLSVVPKYGG